jgi:hypothetical protein
VREYSLPPDDELHDVTPTNLHVKSFHNQNCSIFILTHLIPSILPLVTGYVCAALGLFTIFSDDTLRYGAVFPGIETSSFTLQ